MAVHIGHLTLNEGTFWRHITDLGARGVQLFFVVSAFSLLLSWHSRGDSALAFYVRRFFRIAPMFWLALVFYTLVRPPADGIVWPHVLANLLFLHGWHPQTINTVVPGGWSIAVEMSFYVLFPALALLRDARAVAIAALLALGAAAILHSLPFAIWGNYDHTLVVDFSSLWLPTQLPVFLVGFLAFHAVNSELTPSPRTLSLLVWMTLAIMLGLGFVPQRWTSMPMALAFGGLFGVIVFAAARASPSVWLARPIRSLGIVSYSAYLTHFFIIDCLRPFITSSNQPFHFILALGLVLAATAAISALTYRFIEIPGIKFGKHAINYLTASFAHRAAPSW